jgi:hypothetical protein
MSNDEQATDRQSLEAQADEVRAKLATTLERLDRKRHEIAHLADVPAQIEEHVVPLAAGAAIVLVATGALITWSVVRLATRPERRPRERIEALRRAWLHPENVGRKRSTFVGDLLRKLAMGVATTLAMQVVKRAISSPQLAEAFPRLKLLPGVAPKRRKRTRPSAISGSRLAVADEAHEPSGSASITDIARTGDAG